MALTGTPTPCVSLFRPVAFDGSFSVCRPGLWHQGQALLARAATEAETRRLLRSAIASSEPRLLACIEAGDAAAAEAGAQAWDEAWLEGSGDSARAS